METEDSVLLWKMPSFDVRNSLIDDMVKRARKGRALVLDLRDNPGGRVKALHRLVSRLFAEDSVDPPSLRECSRATSVEPQ